MVFANSQAVWRFPVAFQLVWAFATVAVFYSMPGEILVAIQMLRANYQRHSAILICEWGFFGG
jgi:hypothetical protein